MEKSALNEIVAKGTGVTFGYREKVIKYKAEFIANYCCDKGIKFVALKDWHVRLEKDAVIIDLYLASHTYHFVAHETRKDNRGPVRSLESFLNANFSTL